MKEKLLGKTPEELREVAVSCGLPPYVGGQISHWMYKKRVGDIALMSNISKEGRARLSERWEVGKLRTGKCRLSSDGTKKYLFDFGFPLGIESVMIPDRERRTLCVSSQAGCKMACSFCMTGRQGFHGQLSAADILSQFLSVDEAEELSNAVFMGMGEPLDNYVQVKRAIDVLTSPWGFGWSPRRITLSTIGVLPKLVRYMDECKCHVAISMHTAFGDEREALMPAQKVWPLDEVVELLRKYDFSGQRRVSFEYIMFGGFNDDKRHADALARLLRGLECRVNLIRFHKIPDFPYTASPEPVMEFFRDRVSRYGLTCTIRASRGEDILAACGLLAGEKAQE